MDRWAGLLNTNRAQSTDSQDRGLSREGLWGLWFQAQMTQQHPGAPSLKNNGPSVQETLTQPVLRSSLPPHATPPLPTSCSFALALTGREQGMLIKGCENQEEKREASSGYRGWKIACEEWCVPLWIGNRAEIERWDLWQKPGLEMNDWAKRQAERDDRIQWAGVFQRICCGIEWTAQELGKLVTFSRLRTKCLRQSRPKSWHLSQPSKS